MSTVNENEQPETARRIMVYAAILAVASVVSLIVLWPDVDSRTRLYLPADTSAAAVTEQNASSQGSAEQTQMANSDASSSKSPDSADSASGANPVTRSSPTNAASSDGKTATPAASAQTSQRDEPREVVETKWTNSSLNSNQLGLLLAALGGLLGACIYVLVSMSSFYGNRQLKASWFHWYGWRPLIGAGLGMLVVMGSKIGSIDGLASFDATNPFQVVFIAGLAGLFSRQILDKLMDVVDAFFKSSRDESRRDSLVSNGRDPDGSDGDKQAEGTGTPPV